MNKEKKPLNIRLPADLHKVLFKLSVDSGLTVTAIITQYIQYLKTKHYKKREVLHENSSSDFKINANVPR